MLSPALRSPRMSVSRRQLRHFAPQRVIQFEELELWRGRGRLEGFWLFHSAQVPVCPVGMIAVTREQFLLVCDVQVPVVEPNRHTLTRQPTLGINDGSRSALFDYYSDEASYAPDELATLLLGVSIEAANDLAFLRG